MDKDKQISVRLSGAELRELQGEARKRCVSLGWLVRERIKHGRDGADHEGVESGGEVKASSFSLPSGSVEGTTK